MAENDENSAVVMCENFINGRRWKRNNADFACYFFGNAQSPSQEVLFRKNGVWGLSFHGTSMIIVRKYPRNKGVANAIKMALNRLIEQTQGNKRKSKRDEKSLLILRSFAEI